MAAHDKGLIVCLAEHRPPGRTDAEAGTNRQQRRVLVEDRQRLDLQRTLRSPLRCGGQRCGAAGGPNGNDRVTGEVGDVAAEAASDRYQCAEAAVEQFGHLLGASRTALRVALGQRGEAGHIGQQHGGVEPLARRQRPGVATGQQAQPGVRQPADVVWVCAHRLARRAQRRGRAGLH